MQAVRATKRSPKASSLLLPHEYSEVLRDNVFDLLLVAVAKRLFLERVHCAKVDGTDRAVSSAAADAEAAALS